MADYTITEAGFGADLGAEKFLDIKTPNLPTTPDAVVIVATLRALKMHGGVAKTDLSEENVQAVRDGFSNLMCIILLFTYYKYRYVISIPVIKSMFLLNWLAFGLMVLMVVLTLPTR